MSKPGYFENMQGAFRDVIGTEFLAAIPEIGFNALSPEVSNFMVAGLVTLFGDKFLKNNDRQQLIARVMTVIIPNSEIRRSAAILLEEVIEEAVKRQNEFGGDHEQNKRIAAAIITKHRSGGLTKAVKEDKPSEKPSSAKGLLAFVSETLSSNRETIEENLKKAGDAAEAWAEQSAKERATRKFV